MFDDFSDELVGLSGALDALKDLEKNTSAAILAQRSSERIDVNVSIVVRPGNASQRGAGGIQGMTGDLSNGGGLILLPRPIVPGDIYWIEFDQSEIKLSALFARCMRCRMVKEDAFEAGLRFLQDVDLASALAATAEAQV